MRGAAPLLAALLLAEAATGAVARAEEGCSYPIAVDGALTLPFGTLRTVAPAKGPEVFFFETYGRPLVIRGHRLERWSGDAWPSLPQWRPVVNTPSGRHFLVTGTGGRTTVLTRDAETGRYATLLTTPLSDVWVDEATGRIFARDGADLLEWTDGSWGPSALMNPGGDGVASFDPAFGRVRFLPALRAWMTMEGDRLWLRHEQAADWEKVGTVQTWRSRVRTTAPKLFEDKSSNLAVLVIDVGMLVFDVSGPRPEFLYQHMIRQGAVAQAGKGRVVVELLSPRQDAGWFETASPLRMVTRDGAWPVPGAVLPDPPSKPGSEVPRAATYRLQSLGDSVLIGGNGILHLFDGATLLDMPGLHALFPDKPPVVTATAQGTFLTGGAGVWLWTGGDAAEAVVAEDGTRPDSLIEGDSSLAFSRASETGTRLWISRDGRRLDEVPLPPETGALSLVALPGTGDFYADSDTGRRIVGLCDSPRQP
ncbi:hypothetical protein [Salipiger sp.]|uniref:hypothetical protein n=1 Tax=Salipiger sp. TaxID=2078585 RepID=UPI003A984E6D